jgi:hypothetical protein
MNPVSLIASCQHVLDFAPTTSMVGSGEKLGMNPRITQPGWGLCREPFFSEAVVCSTLLMTSQKVATCEPSMESVCRVGQVFPRRVYINSNHRDSQI